MNRVVFFLVIFVLVAVPVHAETVVRGRVFDDKGKKTVEFANVGVYRSDSKLVGACASDGDGNFEIKVHKNGDYQITVSFLGCGSWVKKIHCAGGELDLGKIRLKEDNEELDAAGIFAKTLIKKESDRIVYDVSADPDAARMNMSAFMSKVPGLKMSVRNGDLEYGHIPLEKILIDDKENDMICKSRQYPMSFIKADYMSKIELILPNSPEYNNAAPMLVITLDKPLPFGAAAQLTGYSSSHNSHDFTPDAVVNTPLIGIGLRYSFNYENKPSLTDEYSRTSYSADGSAPSSFEGNSTSDSDSKGQNLNMNLFRTFMKDKLRFNASIGTNRQDSHERLETESSIMRPGQNEETTVTASTKATTSPFRLNAGFRANYDWRRGCGVTVKYTMRNSESSSYENLFRESSGDPLYNHSANSDLQHNISANLKFRDKNRKWGAKIETGYMFRDYNDRTEYWSGSIGGMDYNQGVAYTDAMVLGNLFKRKMGFSIGVKTEYVDNKGMDLTSSKSLDYNEFNLIPMVGISWIFLKDYKLSSSYICRSRRPRQEQLNPYSDTSDPYNIKTGNPDLKGEVSHSVSCGLQRNFKVKWLNQLTVNASYDVTPNAIQRISTVNEDNVRTTSYANIGRHSSSSVSLAGKFRPTDKIDLNVQVSHRRSRYEIYGEKTNTFNSFSLSENASFDLGFAQVGQSLLMLPTGVTAQSKDLRVEPLMDLTVSKYWEKANFGGTIGIEDVLHGRSYMKSTIFSSKFVQKTWTRRRGRMIYISLYWRIGKFRQTERVTHSSYDLN